MRRSAPVLGRSDVPKQWGLEILPYAGCDEGCCTRGLCTFHLSDVSNAWFVLPLLLWRRGSGRGGPPPFSILRFVATFQRIPAPIYSVLAENDDLLSLSLSSKGGEGNGAADNRHQDTCREQRERANSDTDAFAASAPLQGCRDRQLSVSMRRAAITVIPQLLAACAGLDGDYLLRFQRQCFFRAFLAHHRTARALAAPRISQTRPSMPSSCPSASAPIWPNTRCWPSCSGARCARSPRRATPPWRWSKAGLVLALVALYAASDEIHQAFVPSREASAWDVLLDTTGAAFGLLCLWAAGRLRKRW